MSREEKPSHGSNSPAIYSFKVTLNKLLRADGVENLSEGWRKDRSGASLKVGCSGNWWCGPARPPNPRVSACSRSSMTKSPVKPRSARRSSCSIPALPLQASAKIEAMASSPQLPHESNCDWARSFNLFNSIISKRLILNNYDLRGYFPKWRHLCFCYNTLRYWRIIPVDLVHPGIFLPIGRS